VIGNNLSHQNLQVGHHNFSTDAGISGKVSISKSQSERKPGTKDIILT
jgi:hypothetical protein